MTREKLIELAYLTKEMLEECKTTGHNLVINTHPTEGPLFGLEKIEEMISECEKSIKELESR